MRFVGLEFAFHDNTLLQQICQSGHDDGVEHVDLEKVSVTDMKAVERDTLDEGDPGDEARIFTILITPIADGKRMIDGKMQAVNICADCTRSVGDDMTRDETNSH